MATSLNDRRPTNPTNQVATGRITIAPVYRRQMPQASRRVVSDLTQAGVRRSRFPLDKHLIAAPRFEGVITGCVPSFEADINGKHESVVDGLLAAGGAAWADMVVPSEVLDARSVLYRYIAVMDWLQQLPRNVTRDLQVSLRPPLPLAAAQLAANPRMRERLSDFRGRLLHNADTLARSLTAMALDSPRVAAVTRRWNEHIGGDDQATVFPGAAGGGATQVMGVTAEMVRGDDLSYDTFLQMAPCMIDAPEDVRRAYEEVLTVKAAEDGSTAWTTTRAMLDIATEINQQSTVSRYRMPAAVRAALSDSDPFGRRDADFTVTAVRGVVRSTAADVEDQRAAIEGLDGNWRNALAFEMPADMGAGACRFANGFEFVNVLPDEAREHLELPVALPTQTWSALNENAVYGNVHDLGEAAGMEAAGDEDEPLVPPGHLDERGYEAQGEAPPAANVLLEDELFGDLTERGFTGYANAVVYAALCAKRVGGELATADTRNGYGAMQAHIAALGMYRDSSEVFYARANDRFMDDEFTNLDGAAVESVGEHLRNPIELDVMLYTVQISMMKSGHHVGAANIINTVQKLAGAVGVERDMVYWQRMMASAGYWGTHAASLRMMLSRSYVMAQAGELSYAISRRLAPSPPGVVAYDTLAIYLEALNEGRFFALLERQDEYDRFRAQYAAWRRNCWRETPYAGYLFDETAAENAEFKAAAAAFMPLAAGIKYVMPDSTLAQSVALTREATRAASNSVVGPISVRAFGLGLTSTLFNQVQSGIRRRGATLGFTAGAAGGMSPMIEEM